MAEYKDLIELIAGITPKNNGNFPLVNARDVQVDDTGKRLDEKLEEIEQNAPSDGVTPIFEVDEVVTLEAGENARVTIDNADPAHPRISFGIPEGADGAKGNKGAYVTSVDEMGGDETKTTYKMRFSDGTGHDFDVYHGRDGADGKDGSNGKDGKSAYAYAQEGGYDGTESQFSADLATIPDKVDKSYIVSVFGELKTALENADIDGAIAVLDQAILDMATLA